MTEYHSGAVLGAKLEELVRAANGEMPIVEAAYDRIRAKVQDSQYMISTAFLRHADFGGGGGDKHTSNVQRFGEILAACFKESQESISATAAALRLAAQEYARSDTEAGNQLKDLMKDDYTEGPNGQHRPIPDLPL